MWRGSTDITARGPATAPVAFDESRPTRKGSRWIGTIVSLNLLVAVVAVTTAVVRRDHPVRLEVDGKAIRNAGTVLDQATAAFGAVVTADGAALPPSARCYFAPPEKATSSSRTDPRVACGPVLLGVSDMDRPWVVGRVAYSASSETEVIGRFDAFRTVEALDAGRLRRPDGRRAPRSPKLVPSTEGLRGDDGKRLLGEADVLSGTDAAFLRAAGDARASVSEGSRCYFGYIANREGQRISDGKLWCGPVLLLGSDPARPWVAYPLRTETGGLFATAALAPVTVSRVSSTTALAAGIELFRPDGKQPPGADQTLAAPDAPARPPGFTEVLTSTPPGVHFTQPTDGRLITPGRTLTLNGLARTAKIGAGREAVVAAPGEDLVIARFVRSRPADAPAGGEGTAVILIDAARLPFSRWPALPEQGVLVVSVPQTARTVDLEVLFDGRAQTISMLTGTWGPGTPAALYRSTTTVGIGQAIDVSVTVAEGQVVRARGTATEARMDGWREDDRWAPSGKAYVSLAVSGWVVDRPCCAVSRIEVTPAWRVVLPDGTTADAIARPSSSSASQTPVFAVPDAFTEGRVELTLTVRYERAGRPGEVRSDPSPIVIRIPT